jgi:hypothetical protein
MFLLVLILTLKLATCSWSSDIKEPLPEGIRKLSAPAKGSDMLCKSPLENVF